MDNSRVFKLPVLYGMQLIRLDQDSLEYDWNGLGTKFHGTLPYENLQLKKRVMRKDQRFGLAALFVGMSFLSFAQLLPPYLLVFFSHWTGVAFAMMVAGFIVQLMSGGRICVQIDPRPFGFNGELPIPDTKAGRAFLVELEAAWNESLRRRFLSRELVDDQQWLQRINWLEFIGVLTSEEAATHRLLVNSDSRPEQTSVGHLAFN